MLRIPLHLPCQPACVFKVGAGDVEASKLDDALAGFQNVLQMEEGQSEWCADLCPCCRLLLECSLSCKAACTPTQAPLGADKCAAVQVSALQARAFGEGVATPLIT